jgi:hypothetical protein
MRNPSVRVVTLLLGAAAFLGAALWPVAVDAQTAFVPYYGKNRVRYTQFDWHIYKTEHFDIFYYPELEPHLERVTSYAESAYSRLSSELKHDLVNRVPLILFKTQSEFQTQNISGGELPEGVLAFAESERNRMVLPIDEPPDQLYRLITHELTHIFEFDIIPRGLMSSGLPLWVDEGLANYMAGYWNVLDLMQVRDAALTDNVPKMSRFESQPLTGRLPYSMGHAAFEFIESRWGKDGLREFLFSLRKNVISPGDTAYEEALKLKPEEFDDQFDRYIKERFKPFRDKQRPADFGRDLAPSPERSRYSSVLSIEPAPSGEMIAAVVGNRHDFELDIVLLSARDGQVIRNLTKGFDKDRGFEYISSAGGLRGNLVPWIAWDPVGDFVAYFVRTEKEKTLIVQNIVTGRTERRIELKTVDAPESPSFSRDGRTIAFSALQNGIGDIFTVDLETGAVTNVTNDTFADYAPAFSPDGRSLVYSARVSGNDKLFRVNVPGGEKLQITFGAHDDVGARFLDANTLVFTSTATDPAEPVLPSVEANGRIPNVWTLDLGSGELKQLTDVATGLVSPVPIRPGLDPNENAPEIAFVSYYKGVNGIHTMTIPEQPIATVATADFGEPGQPILGFVPPQSHTFVPDNVHRKGAFERMSLAARPGVGLGLTSGGDFYGNTQVTFTDVLGDKAISFYAQSYSQFRTTALTYINIANRLQYVLQGFSQDQFYYGQNSYLFQVSPFVDRDFAQAVRSQRGATAIGIYPFNRYTRVEMSGGYVNLNERFTNSSLQALADGEQIDRYGSTIFRRGHSLPLGVALVQETTVFRDYGPVAGNTIRIGFDGSPGFNDGWLSRRTVDIDARHYTRIGANGVLATRLRAQRSWGNNPDFLFFGGNSEMRGYGYLEFLGHKAFFANAELRFPLIEAMLTPIGVLGGLRGAFFFNIGGAGFNNQDFRFASNHAESIQPTIDFTFDANGNPIPVLGDPVAVSGWRLVDSRASYGIGLESFILGFPMHFDWSWRTLFNKGWEDVQYFVQGGSSAFRKVKFSFWIGYDF